MKTGKRKKAAVAAVFFILLWMSAGRDLKTVSTPLKTAVVQNFVSLFGDTLYSQFLPGAAQLYAGGGEKGLFLSQVEGMLPLYGMARREMAVEGQLDEGDSFEKQSDVRENGGQPSILAYDEIERIGTQMREEEEYLQELLQEENEAAAKVISDFVPHEKRMQVDLEELRDYETLVRTFYTIDANTSAGSDRLNLDSLLGRDMTLRKEGDEPQILIYHTHSQEGFADSVPGDTSTTIVGAGERLAEILRTKYGYNVLHHTGQYDVETRDDAYGRALPELERILAENPSIEVVIDLHRDQMPEDTKLVMNLDGRPTARFMFFDGLSRTKKTGDISYLQNANLADNLAFSFQMQLKAQEYYPGLTRKIYLKAYRYNLHLRPKSILIELGAQNNTVEEAMNACDPLAHLLDLVLAGE